MTPRTITHGHASLKINVAKALPQHMRDNVFELTHIRTEPEYRNQGDATGLLLRVCLDADLADKSLLVQVNPDTDSPMDKAELTNWYGQHGFAVIQEAPVRLMVRPCVKLRTAFSHSANIPHSIVVRQKDTPA